MDMEIEPGNGVEVKNKIHEILLSVEVDLRGSVAQFTIWLRRFRDVLLKFIIGDDVIVTSEEKQEKYLNMLALVTLTLMCPMSAVAMEKARLNEHDEVLSKSGHCST